MPLATFVLVHGGGHGGWCYAKVKRLLEADGHEVFAPSLTGLAERSHLLSPEVEPRHAHRPTSCQLLHYWDLHDVVLVGHSYGGMVDHRRRRPRHRPHRCKLVYLDAANPRNGESLVDSAGATLEVARPMAPWSTASSSCSSGRRRRRVLRRH